MSDKVDVVISNCVINLAPDKNKVYTEIKRILKAGGHFSISDIVVTEIIQNLMCSIIRLESRFILF